MTTMPRRQGWVVDCLLWAVFKCRSKPNFWANFSPRLRLCVGFDKVCLGLHTLWPIFLSQTHLFTLSRTFSSSFFNGFYYLITGLPSSLTVGSSIFSGSSFRQCQLFTVFGKNENKSNSFCLEKLNHRMLSSTSPPQKNGNDCQPCTPAQLIFFHAFF
jgi:hypothetical protein